MPSPRVAATGQMAGGEGSATQPNSRYPTSSPLHALEHRPVTRPILFGRARGRSAVRRGGRSPNPKCWRNELFLLLEGARVAAQSIGWKGLDERLVRMGEAMIRAPTIFWGGTPIGPIPEPTP